MLTTLFFSLTTLPTLVYFTTIKMKYLNMLITLFLFTDYTHYVVLFQGLKIKSLSTLTMVLYFSTIKIKSLTRLTTLFYFTPIKMKYLTTLTKLFFSSDYTHYAALLHYYLKEISEYAHYAVFLCRIRSLRCFTSLLLNGNL